MIKANELRVGNWFYIGEMIGQCNVDSFKDTSIFDPIPLSPEILEKYGWVWNEECKSFEGKDVRMNLQHNPVNESYTMFNYVLKAKIAGKIYFLHQLQNLYFALTGEELNYIP